MEQFTAYHVVTERPMHLGQRITIDEQFRSGVFQRVMDKQPIVNDILAHPERYTEPLEHHTDVALRELALEEVRLAKFPEYPSRLHCLYVSETLQESEQWADYFASLGRPTYHIVRLEITGRRFIGDATLCFDGSPDQARNFALAERYWHVEPHDEPAIQEFLVDGEILVAEIMKEINANLE